MFWLCMDMKDAIRKAVLIYDNAHSIRMICICLSDSLQLWYVYIRRLKDEFYGPNHRKVTVLSQT